MSELKEFQEEKAEKQKEPEEYTLFDEPKIKAPLSVLHYNLNFIFEDDYPAKLHPDFARDMIMLYSHKGDLVYDGFCGSGTVPIVAAGLGRYGLGTDINPKAIELSLKKQKRDKVEQFTKFEVADVRDYSLPIGSQKIDLILSSAPFGLSIAGDKNNYSEEKGDMSNSKTYEEFFEKVEVGLANYFKLLKPNGILILDARDRTRDGVYYDTINYFRNSALKAGFRLIGRYYYELIPFRQWTAKDKETKFVKPMPEAMDVIILKKPQQESLEVFS